LLADHFVIWSEQAFVFFVSSHLVIKFQRLNEDVTRYWQPGKAMYAVHV